MKKFKHTNADLELARIQTEKDRARGQEEGEDGTRSDNAGSEGRRFGRRTDRDDPTVRHNDAGAGRTRRYNGGSGSSGSSRNRRGRRRTAGSNNSRY